MRENDSREIAAVLLLAAAVAAVLVMSKLGDGLALLGDLGKSPLTLVVFVAALLALVALGVLRRLVIGRALGRRVRVQLVPSDDFDPADEAVTRFAAALGRTQRVLHGLLDRPASSARLLLSGDPAGRLRYEVDLPAYARTALTNATYPEVELHDTTPDTDEDVRPAAGAVARVELVLARSSIEPLRQVGLDPDPLMSVARAIGNVEHEAGEAAEVCIDLLPLTAGRRGRVRRRLLRQARREHQHQSVGAAFGELIDSPRRGGRGGALPADLVERRSGQRALTSKLGSPEPLFELQVLVQATAPTRGRAVQLVQGLAATFDQFTGENHFRARGLRLPGGLALLGGADGLLRRRRFDRRLRTGLFRPGRAGIVTASEIAGLLKPPSVKCVAPNVVRSGGVIPPPPSGLPTFHGQPDLLPLGRVSTQRGERLVGVPLRDTFFSYMGGRSRYGKTETAIGQCLHLARSGHGVFFLDPHEDAIAKLKGYLTDEGLRERVVEINLADPDRQPGWNLFASHGLPASRRAERVDAVVDAFASALNWGEQNTRALNLITQAAQALTELSARLPQALAPTLFQVPTLLGNDEWRDAVLPFVSPATRSFFVDRFPRLSTEAITPVTNLIDRLRVSPSVAALLGSPVSTYDVRAAMDRGQIVLACPGSGSVRDRLIANFLVYDLLHQAKTRAELAPEQRRPFYLFLDEVQTYDGAASDTLAALLEQAAKYGIRACLFNQNPERLSPATWNAVSTNRSHLMSTAMNSKAAAMLAREWGGQVKPDVLTKIERYTYLASVTLNAEISPPFLIHGVPVEDLFPDAYRPDQLGALEDAIDRATGRRAITGAVAALNDHDQAILQHLCPQGDEEPDPDGDEEPSPVGQSDWTGEQEPGGEGS